MIFFNWGKFQKEDYILISQAVRRKYISNVILLTLKKYVYLSKYLCLPAFFLSFFPFFVFLYIIHLFFSLYSYSYLLLYIPPFNLSRSFSRSSVGPSDRTCRPISRGSRSSASARVRQRGRP